MKNLVIKAFIGLAVLGAVMGAILFVAAGTGNYWEGWTYLAVFLSCCFFITIYLVKRDLGLLQRRLAAGPGGENDKAQKVIQTIAQFGFISIYVLSGLDRRFGWSDVPLIILVAGNAGVIVGFYIVFRTFKENTFTAANISVGAGQTVIATGPYAAIRHPMYSGALLLLLCTPIALGSWWGLSGFIPMCAIIIARLLHEERFLTQNLEGYAGYCSRVRFRLLPGLF